jgi:tetratricopeptide (TPR) repeat protein
VPSGDLLAARNRVKERATLLILPRLGENMKFAESRSETRSANAWALVQRAAYERKGALARYNAGDREASLAQLKVADSLLQQAEAADPSWAEPVAQRARIAADRARRTDRVTMTSRWQEGVALADRALAIDTAHSGAFEVRGTLRYQLSNFEADPAAAERLFSGAEQDLTAATTVDPRNAYAWFVLSLVHAAQSDYIASALAAQRAYDADKYLERAPQILWQLFATSYSMEQHATAKKYCDEGAKRFPANPQFVECQLWTMTTRADSADPARARRLITELEKVKPAADWEFARRESQMLLAAVMVRAAARQPAFLDSARALLLTARGDPTVDPARTLLTREAFVRTLMGDNDTAIELLQRYLLENPSAREEFGRENDWWWRGLQDDPRFLRLTGSR